MLQTSISFDTPQAAPRGEDRCAFEIGWDHARHGLHLPAPWPAERGPQPLRQGWQAAQAVFGRRTWPARPAVRQWLALRLAAWQAGEAFDTDELTPQHLAQIATLRCPVRRVPLGGAAGTADAPVVVRLNAQAAWAAGHLVTLSTAAAQAMAGVDVDEARRRARACERACERAGEAAAALEGDATHGLDAAGWWRVAALRGYATPLPFATAACLPLAVLPPNRVRLLNAAQGLQALVTQTFAAPGWAGRCAAVAALLPEHTLRHDFNLFVGAMAPRALAAPAAGQGLRDALEDAWLHERVQRRWQHLVLSLGEAGTEALLDRVAALPQPGRHVLQHAPAQAVEAWRLPARTERPALARLAGRTARRGAGAGTTIAPGAAHGTAPHLAPAARNRPIPLTA